MSKKKNKVSPQVKRFIRGIKRVQEFGCPVCTRSVKDGCTSGCWLRELVVTKGEKPIPILDERR